MLISYSFFYVQSQRASHLKPLAILKYWYIHIITDVRRIHSWIIFSFNSGADKVPFICDPSLELVLLIHCSSEIFSLWWLWRKPILLQLLFGLSYDIFLFVGCIGTLCPCYLFGKNAEFLGSGTMAGSCMTHFILWGLFNSLCCMFTGGILTIIPGATVACYACGYRKALRTKYNIQVYHCFLE